MKVRISILHYGDVEVTKKTLNSILSLDENLVAHITVVNNSPQNAKFVELTNEFGEFDKIEFISTGLNMGFSKGNNIGYQYERELSEEDLIIVMNNDIEISDKRFFERIINSYKNDKYDIMGPDIVNLDGLHQNPFRTKTISRKQLQKRIIIKRLFYLYYKFKKSIPALSKVKLLERAFDKKSKKVILERQSTQNTENPTLHGAFLVYSPKYIKNEQFAFLPITFMYGEEDILSYYCDLKGYKRTYDPTIRILHLEGASTKESYTNDLERNLFFTKNTLSSSIALLNLMREG